MFRGVAPRLLMALGILVVLWLAYLLSLSGRSPSPNEQGEQRTAAFELIDAIEAYRSTNGRYPNALGALTPGYIAVVPSPFDDEYGYRLDRQGQEFEMSDGRCSWMSFFEFWDCTRGHP